MGWNFGESPWDAQSGQSKILAVCTLHLWLAARSQQLTAPKLLASSADTFINNKTGRAQVRLPQEKGLDHVASTVYAM